MIWSYPPEVHAFVKENCTKMRDAALAEACNKALGTNFTPARMKAFRGNHGYRNGLPNHMTKEEYMEKAYPRGMYAYIRDNSWGVSSKEMAEKVNEIFGTDFTPGMIKQFRQRHGIKSGVTGWFRKGRSPGNKGKKLEEYLGPERAAKVKERLRATMFKKGDRPMNEMPVGTITVNSEGYKIRKRQMEGTQWERWEPLHRAVWEEHNGPIPEGMCITFKDGDRLNCDISNLMMVSRGEMAVSALHQGGRICTPGVPLQEAQVALARLKIAAYRARTGNK